MFIILLFVHLSMAEWTEPIRKQNYMQCLFEVSDFKDGFLEDPVLAHDICSCVMDILEQNAPDASDVAIARTLDQETEKFYPCRDEYQLRKKMTNRLK